MSDPIKEEREYIGKFVILYLLIFSILSYLLYREFKKDLH
jgi:cytochrome c1